MKVIILFFILSVSVYSKNPDIKIPESECRDVDVRDKMPDELKEQFSSPRNQDSIGWCYGFAAADLITAEVGYLVSAAHVSANFNKSIDDSIFMKSAYEIGKIFRKGNFEETYEGGFIGSAISTMSSDRKLCTEKEFPFDTNYSGEMKDLILRLEDLKQYTSNEEDSEIFCREAKILTSQYKLDIELRDLYIGLEKMNLNSLLSEIIEKNCTTKLDIPKFSVGSISRPRFPQTTHKFYDREYAKAKKNTKKFFSKIDDLLSRGKPLGIGYNVSHVTKYDGLHASVVTGRRWKNGQCQFRIRNSWGESCAIYDSSKIEGCSSSEGSYWVSDEKFFKMAYSLEYID